MKKGQGRQKSVAELLFREEAEARRRGETTPFQQKMVTGGSLEVTRFLEKRKLVRPDDRWETREQPFNIARRTVEVAMMRAIDASETRGSERREIMADWKLGERHARRAYDSLKELLEWAVAEPPDTLERAVGLANRIHGLALEADRHLDPKQRRMLSRRRADVLLQTENILSALPGVFAMHRQGLVHQNFGEIEKGEFVRTLAEGWFFLMRRVPGLGEPFAGFVQAAWNDVGGLDKEDPDNPEPFDHTIRMAIEAVAIDHTDGWQPHWRPHWL